MAPGRADGPLWGRTARGGPGRAPPLDPGLPARRPLLPASGARPAGPRRTGPGGGAAGGAGRPAGRPGPCAWVAEQSPPLPAAWVAPPRQRAGAVPRPPGSQVLTARRRRPGRRPPVHMAPGQRPPPLSADALPTEAERARSRRGRGSPAPPGFPQGAPAPRPQPGSPPASAPRSRG